MKKYKFNMLLIALSLLFTQCYKDNSNKDIKTINPIVIDNSVQEQRVSVNQMEVLHVMPVVYKNGVEDANLEYQWVLTGDGIVPTTLGTTMTLHAVVSAPPKPDSYNLTLTVTDSETGIRNFATYYVTVQSNLGTGLLVADSRDGGLTSDVSLIRAENFCANYDARKNRTFKDMYSSVNGDKIQGRVTGLTSTQGVTGGSRYLTIITDDYAVRIDPFDFGKKDENKELFYTEITSAMKPKKVAYIQNLNQANCINIDGDIYIHNMKFANKYSAKLETIDNSTYKIGKMSDSGLLNQTTWQAEMPFLFDELNGRMLQVASDISKITVFEDLYQTSPFDFNRMKDLDILFMGRGQSSINSTIQMVVKTKSSSKYYCYVFDIKGPTPLYVYDLSGCENFASAVAYECNPMEDVFYYATKDGIYSVPMSGGSAVVARKSFTPKAGEEISGMKLWRGRGWLQGKVRISDPNEPSGYQTIQALNRMLVISTYNRGTSEGKIISLPLPRLGSGDIESNNKYHIEYGGFGEIVEFDHQSL